MCPCFHPYFEPTSSQTGFCFLLFVLSRINLRFFLLISSHYIIISIKRDVYHFAAFSLNLILFATISIIIVSEIYPWTWSHRFGSILQFHYFFPVFGYFSSSQMASERGTIKISYSDNVVQVPLLILYYNLFQYFKITLRLNFSCSSLHVSTYYCDN